MKQKIAVVGCSGFIAGNFIPTCVNANMDVLKIGTEGGISDVILDLLQAESFPYDCLSGVEIVIFMAAISSPDLCEKEFERCWAINVTGTSIFIKNALALGCKVLFFSSDAVFGEDLGVAFDENSVHRPNTAYGKMKEEIERSFYDNPNFLIARLSYVFAINDKFTKYLLNCKEDKICPQLYHPFYRNVITFEMLEVVLLYIISHLNELPSRQFNMVGAELVSRVKIADTVFRTIGETIAYDIIAMPERFKIARPLVTHTKSIYLPNIVKNYYTSFEEQVHSEFERRNKK